MQEIIVRDAEVKDAPQIAKVHVKTWQCAYRGQIAQDYLDSLSVEQRTKKWEERLSNPKPEFKIFVAILNNSIVGFAGVGPCRDEDMTGTGELWAIYVDPDNMGKGAGSALMKKSLEHFKENGFKKAALWVLTTNEKAKKWYELKGWKLEGKTKIDIVDGVKRPETRYTISL